jgi:hypothetical protein
MELKRCTRRSSSTPSSGPSQNDRHPPRAVGAHPLVHQQPYVGSGRRLLVEAQKEAGVRADYKHVAPVGGQLLLLPPAEAFVKKVVWDQDPLVRWQLHTDPKSLFASTPRSASVVRPSAGSAPRWSGSVEADESFDEVADEFELTADEVRSAYAYEVSARAA